MSRVGYVLALVWLLAGGLLYAWQLLGRVADVA
jgi:hypothetical protein